MFKNDLFESLFVDSIMQFSYLSTQASCTLTSLQVGKLMLKNITLSADEELIRRAREKARREHTTLNAHFRKWLKQYVNSDNRLNDYDALMQSLSYARPGKTFTRDELNER